MNTKMWEITGQAIEVDEYVLLRECMDVKAQIRTKRIVKEATDSVKE